MKQRYTLGVSVNIDGSINYAGVNDNKDVGHYVLLDGDVQFPLFVHERLALLKVRDTYGAVMLGIGRKLAGGLYTIYLNQDEYKQLKELTNDTREESQK